MFGTNTFGAPGTTFGGGSFTGGGATTNVFQSQAQPSTSLFGATSTFNTSFGNANKPAFGTAGFGTPQTTSLFGQQNRLGPQQTPMFGSTNTGNTGFGAPGMGQQAQGTSIPFNAITGSDTMMKNGVQSPISTRHQCITCMKEYENKCFEELRAEDYQLGRKGQPQGGMFGGAVQNQGGGLFSTPTSVPTSAFGQRPNTTFGQPAPTGGLFSNLNQNKTSFFTPTTSSTFGTSTFAGLGNQTAPQTSLFGQNTSTATTGGIATPAFSFNQQPQQQNMGLFGAKPLTTPATSATPFGGFGVGANTTQNKPLGLFSTPTTGFGTSAAPAFGTTTTTPSLFGTNPQQPKVGAFGFGQNTSTFGVPPASSAFTFPTPSSSSNIFSGTAPFGTTAPTTSSFGFGSSFGTTPSFSLGNPTGASTGFNTGSLGFSQPSTSAFNFNMPSQNLFGQPQNQTPQSPPTGPVPFATSPYKDSPLFYNLLKNRSLDEMTKPTNPLAQSRSVKEATRRTSSAHASHGTQAAIKTMTFPVSKINVYNKQNSIFDGFEDAYDHGPSMDILSPKTSVKKLNLKNVRGSSRLSVPNASSSFNLSTSSNGFRRDSNFDSSDLANHSFTNDGSNQLPIIRETEQVGDSANNVNTSINGSILEPTTPPPTSHKTNDSQSSVDELDSRRKALESDERKKADRIEPVSINTSGVVSTRPDYYIIPGQSELNYLTGPDGKCIVKNFRVGRINHGEVRFLEPVNVAGINIDEIVMFRHKEIVVYPEDSSPRVGEGLNVPAEVTLERVWPLEKGTKDPIKNPERIRAMKYESLLRRSCGRMDAQFVSYDDHQGKWTFRVKHFSKYSCVPEENDEEDAEDEAMTVDKRPVRGLGGVTLTELKGSSSSTEKMSVGLKEKESEPFLLFKSPQPVEISTEIIPSNDGFKGLGGTPPSAPFSSEPFNYDKFLSPRSREMENMLSGRSRGLGHHVPITDIAEYFDSTFKENLNEPSNELALSRYGLADDGNEYWNKKAPEPVMSISTRQPQQPVKGTSERSERQIWKYYTRSQVTRKQYLNRISLFEGFRETLAQDLVPRRCARACFGRDGHLVVVNNGVLTTDIQFNGIVSIKKLDHVAKSAKKINLAEENRNLVAALNLYLESSEFEGDSLVLRNNGIISEHLELLRDLDLRTSKASGLSGEILVWELMHVLFSCIFEATFSERESQSFAFIQRKVLGNWFAEKSSILFGSLYNSDNGNVKSLLLKGRKHEACKLAVKEKNYHLSLCLAQNDSETQIYCDNQRQYWEQEGAIEFIEPEILELYLLCGGSPIWHDINLEQMSTWEWLQHFALFVWYIAPSYYTIADVVSSYHSSLMECAPGDDISFPALSKTSSSMPNLCIHILKVFSSTGYPLSKLLCPKTYSEDSCDYKVSWFLANIFRQLGYDMEPSLYESITSGFANQLETMGYWEWALVILKYLPTSQPRSIMIKRILERNSQAFMSPNDNSKERIQLLSKINIKTQAIEEIRIAMSQSK